MQIFLKEFILDSFERRHAQHLDYQIGGGAMDHQSQQGITGHMHHYQTTHNTIILLILKYQHSQWNTNSSFQSSEGQHNYLLPVDSISHLSQGSVENSYREEPNDYHANVNVHSDHQLMVDIYFSRLKVDNISSD